MKKNYRMKKTISVKMFISELGEDFSENIKKRLMGLDVRCVLTRKYRNCVLDIKHVEHKKYDFTDKNGTKTIKKEYVYGEFIVEDGYLYFSNNLIDSSNSMKHEKVDEIYNSLTSDIIVIEKENEKENDIEAKKIDDDNIDFIIDNILKICPKVSQAYMDIVSEMTSHAEIKEKNTFHIGSY